MKNKHTGFTLIELMIVIAIIAILMSYAIPAYRDYTVRTKVGEGLQLASALKSHIGQGWASSDDMSTYNSGSSGLPAAADVTGNNVSQIQVTAGTILISFNNDANLNGNTLTLAPVFPNAGAGGSSLIWNCSSTLANQFLPHECRTP